MSAIKTEGLGSAVKESSDNYKLQTLFSSSLLIADFCTVLLESFFFLIGVVPLSLSTSAYVLFYFRCCLLSAANFNFCFDGNSYLLWSSLEKTMFFDGTFPFFILRDTRPVDDFFVELARPICLLYLNVIYLRTIFPTTFNNQSYKLQNTGFCSWNFLKWVKPLSAINQLATNFKNSSIFLLTFQFIQL